MNEYNIWAAIPSAFTKYLPVMDFDDLGSSLVDRQNVHKCKSILTSSKNMIPICARSTLKFASWNGRQISRQSFPYYTYHKQEQRGNVHNYVIISTLFWLASRVVFGLWTRTMWTLDSVTRSWCYKTFFGGNLDFPKIKKLNKVCFADWTCTKMLKQCYLNVKL